VSVSFQLSYDLIGTVLMVSMHSGQTADNERNSRPRLSREARQNMDTDLKRAKLSRKGPSIWKNSKMTGPGTSRPRLGGGRQEKTLQQVGVVAKGLRLPELVLERAHRAWTSWENSGGRSFGNTIHTACPNCLTMPFDRLRWEAQLRDRKRRAREDQDLEEPPVWTRV
jgi:hypothetical protein